MLLRLRKEDPQSRFYPRQKADVESLVLRREGLVGFRTAMSVSEKRDDRPGEKGCFADLKSSSAVPPPMWLVSLAKRDECTIEEQRRDGVVQEPAHYAKLRGNSLRGGMEKPPIVRHQRAPGCVQLYHDACPIKRANERPTKCTCSPTLSPTSEVGDS